MNELDYLDRELTNARQALINAEGERDTFKALVEKIEGQRDTAETFLRSLLDESAPYVDTATSRAARLHLDEFAGMDKYERRLTMETL